MKKIWVIYKKHREVISYLFWGGVAFVLSVFLFWVFTSRLGMSEVPANTIDWIILVIFTFFTNKLFVFRSKAGSAKAFGKEFISFILARLFTLLLENVIIWVGCDKLGFHSELGSLVVKLIAQFVVIVSNYILSKLIVFRHRKPDVQADTPETSGTMDNSENSDEHEA